MRLSSLSISNLRNIQQASIELHLSMNLISGLNGSGKTSFLEAIYLLSSGRSFRSRQIESLVKHEAELFTVFAKTEANESISIQKSLESFTEARINRQTCSSSSALAAFLPSQIFYQDIFQFIDSGPQLRRMFLDWGLFHVEPSYLGLLKDYRRVVKQRNSLLRSSPNPKLIAPWDSMLVQLSESLHLLREKYYHALNPMFRKLASEISLIDCNLEYYKGWDRKKDNIALSDILDSSFQRDCLRQYTHYGSHQADLWVICDDYKAKNFLSRGQQKAILFALKFAQVQLIGKPCLLLIDDLMSELDEEKLALILSYLPKLNSQVFVTSRPNDTKIMQKYLGDYYHFNINNGKICLDISQES